MIRFILLSILLTIIMRKLGSLYLYLRRVFGGDKQNDLKRSDKTIRTHINPQKKREKIFKQEEGEYVEYEEV